MEELSAGDPVTSGNRTEQRLSNRAGLLILALSVFAVVTTEMLPVGLLPAISATFGRSESTTGLLVSLYAALVAVLAAPLTVATRAIPRKRLLLIALACFTASNIAAACAPTFTTLAAARALGGATHALFFSICIGYAARLVPPTATGRALALASAGGSAGFVLGMPLATALGNAVGWRGAFIALAVVTALALGAVAIKLPVVASARDEDGPATGHPRRLLSAITPNALTYLGHFTLYTYISVMLLHAHADRGAIGPILLVFGGIGLAGLAVAGPRLDHHLRRTTLTALALVLVGMVISGAGIPHLGIVIVGGVIWNGAFGPMASIYQTAAVRAHASSPDIAGALINASANVGIGGGAALGSLLLQQAGIRTVAWVAAGCIALAIAGVLSFGRSFSGRR